MIEDFNKNIKEIRKALREAFIGVTAQEFMMYPGLLVLAEAAGFVMDIK